MTSRIDGIALERQEASLADRGVAAAADHAHRALQQVLSKGAWTSRRTVDKPAPHNEARGEILYAASFVEWFAEEAKRVYVQDGVYAAFSAKLVAAVAQLRVGDGFGEVDLGPLIDAPAAAKVQAHIADALEQGARLLCGGKSHALGGQVFEPTVLAEARPGMRVAVEETFGPVASLFRFQSEPQVLELANATEFGLAAYFYGRDLGQVWRVAEGLECGIVGVNTGIISSEQAPFGGVKQSGFGREGSRYGLDEYLEIKYVCLGGIEGRVESTKTS